MPRWHLPATLGLALAAAAFVATAASAQEIGDYKFTIAQTVDHNVTGEGHYMLADGRTLSAAAEPNLFAIVGHTFGGSGDDFRLPDMRGRTPVASSDSLTAGTVAGAALTVLDPGLVLGAAFMLIDTAERGASGGNSGPVVPANDVAALFHFDDADLTINSLGDSTGSTVGAVARDTGDAALSSASSLTSTGAGQGFRINSVSGSLDFGTGDFTWEAYARTTEAVNNQQLFTIGLNPQVRYDGALGTWLWDRGGGPADSSFAMPIPNADFRDGNFHHVVWQRNGSTIRMAIDGKWSTSTHTDGSTYNPSAVDVGYISGFSSSWAGQGNLDEVRLSRVAVYDFTQDFVPLDAPFPDN